jgi:hypothetical protein
MELKEYQKKTLAQVKSYLEALDKLKRKSFLKRIGPDKGGHWEIVNV